MKIGAMIFIECYGTLYAVIIHSMDNKGIYGPYATIAGFVSYNDGLFMWQDIKKIVVE